MRKKALREAASHAIPPARIEAMIAAVLTSLRGAGYLDDAHYAAMKARSLADKGRSLAAIRATLARQGIDREASEAAIAGLQAERAEPELAAALAFARRRQLGPWRPAPERAAMRQRDLAALARAGFAAATARELIDAPTVEEVQSRLEAAD